MENGTGWQEHWMSIVGFEELLGRLKRLTSNLDTSSTLRPRARAASCFAMSRQNHETQHISCGAILV